MLKKIILIIITIIVIAGLGYWAISIFTEETEESEKPLASQEEKAIKKLFAEKYDKEISEVTIYIGQETGDYISGGVEFQPGSSEDLYKFLAAKVNDSWKLVYDGQGVISCLTIKSYKFPLNMVFECFDEETGEDKERGSEACINSGGEIITTSCCKSARDFPNLCLIGPCGCSPENSYQVRACDCGSGRCFNANECVDKSR